MVLQTDSMDFKVGELLKEVQLYPAATKAIDQVVSSIVDAIKNIPEQEVVSEYASGFVRDLHVPQGKVSFTFKGPEFTQIGGSYSIGCVAKPNINVDLLIRMPKECFCEKDYLNHIYHAKRCLYLCVIEKTLKYSHLVRKIEWISFRNEARKPILHIYPVINYAELSEFFIRIIPTATSLFTTSRLKVSRNNVRAFSRGDTFRATPYYNSTILEDMFIEDNAVFVKNTFSEWKVLRDALLLVKVWARNRTSIYAHDCLNGYLISIILSYLAAGSTENHINKSMKVMQIFRITMKFLSSNKWEKGLSLRPLVQSMLSMEEKIHFLKAFPSVLYDATGHTNLLYCMTRAACTELQDEAAWTVNCFEKCGGGFEEIFMTKVDLASKFDTCLRINLKGNAKISSSDLYWDDGRWRFVEKDMQSVLEQGLGDRVKLVRVTWSHAPFNWNINEGYENFGKEPMLVGLLLSSQEKCFRVVDIGPHAVNSDEATKYRKFWGEKSELRRFRDGTIAESTVWECSPWQRHLIIERITKYIISKHFLLSQEDVVCAIDQLDFCLHLGGKDPISSSTSLLEAFETLSKRLRLLEDIPLRISSVQPLDSAFRHTAVFPPEPHPLVCKKGITNRIPKLATTCIQPLTVMIQLEGSGNWPLDAKVIESTKAAFLLKICESLQERWGMDSSATESEFNVLTDGYAFSLKILHERSLSLLRKDGNDNIKGKQYIDEELFFRSQHSSMINGLHGRYPAYGSVVRLAKRWVSSHLFSSFLEEEATELIVAYLFLKPFPFHAPMTRITGFLRFLRLLSNYDWTFSPLIVDINEDFTSQDEWEIHENFLLSRTSSEENVQNLKPAMFLASTYDRRSEAWTKFVPNGILKRMAAYAQSSADLLTKLILNGQSGPYTWECLFRTPLNNYDAVVLLHRDKLPYPRRLLFPSMISHGMHVIQGRASKDFHPFIQQQDSDSIQSFDDLRSKLLVNFDPTKFFVEDLKEEFPETFRIWYDSLGGDAIGLTWNSKKRKRDENDGSEASLINTVKEVGEEKIMRIPYGENKEYFRFSLFLVLCNRITTSAVSAGALLISKKTLVPAAPMHKYCVISISNILTTTCQYEALKYVSFPVQTLAKCAKMIPVMVWSTIIMQKKYKGKDYLFAVLVTLGCALFILYPTSGDINPYQKGRESTVWGISLMTGYLGFDGFTSTFQDKLFKGYDMEIHNQIFYTTLCSTFLSFSGLVLQGHLLMAISFMLHHQDCFYDILLLSTVATASQFFISYTIRTFGALTFATIMTTRQLVSIMLSCLWFSHPLSLEQWSGAVIVFGALYTKSFLRSTHQSSSEVNGADKTQESINS